MSANGSPLADSSGAESRPAVVADASRERILRAAAEAFAERGYAGATTRAIAAAAGVNEVTLFRHFGSKLNLLMAVVEQNSGVPDLWSQIGGELTGDYRQDMLRLGHLLQNLMGKSRTSLRLILCDVEQVPELRRALGQLPLRTRQMLADYLRRQIAAGRVRPLDPDLMAQAFLGIFLSYNVGRTFLAEPLGGGMSIDAVVDQLVDLFVSGTVSEP